jgi:hypothetical protein
VSTGSISVAGSAGSPTRMPLHAARRVVDGGEAWMSGTTFDGHRAIRLSVSNWRTTGRDIARTLDAFREAASCSP